MSIDGILRRQAGVITRRQATAAGLSPGMVDDRLRRRRWRPLHPQVYLAAGRPIDHEVRVRAALLWAGEGALLAGGAAAWWFGLLPLPPPTITVLLDRRPPPARPAITVRRRATAAADLAVHRGLRLTARPLTVLDAAAELGPAGTPLLDGALRSWLAYPELLAAHRRNPGAGGRSLLAAAATRADAATRRSLRRRLHDAGLAGWQWAVSPATVTFPDARLAVEVIGWAGPVTRPPTGARPPGWTVLRIPWTDLDAHPQTVLAAITAAIDG